MVILKLEQMRIWFGLVGNVWFSKSEVSAGELEKENCLLAEVSSIYVKYYELWVIRL
jgi:hypothetical protein